MTSWIPKRFSNLLPSWGGKANVDSEPDSDNPVDQEPTTGDPADQEPTADSPVDDMSQPKTVKDKARSSRSSRSKSGDPNKDNPPSQARKKPYDVPREGYGPGPKTTPKSVDEPHRPEPTTSRPTNVPKSASTPTVPPSKPQPKPQDPAPSTTSYVDRAPQPSHAELELQRQYKDLEAKYKALEQKHNEQDALFKIRSRELHGVEAYTLSANTDDELNVTGAIDTLNDTIGHAAEVIAEAFDEAAQQSNSSAAGNQGRDVRYTQWAMQEVQEKLGKTLYDCICTADMRFYGRPIKPTDNRECFEWAVASYLCWWAVRLFSRMTDTDSGEDELRRVYESIRATEPQTISARWRVLACKATQQTESTSALRIKQGLVGILYLAGLSEGALRNETLATALDKYAAKVDQDARGVKHRALQGVVTCDFEMFTVSPGQCVSTQDVRRVGVTDPRAQKASATASKSRNPKTEKHTYQMAVCTVRVGVKKVKMDTVLDRYMVPREEVVILPTVVLHDDFRRS